MIHADFLFNILFVRIMCIHKGNFYFSIFYGAMGVDSKTKTSSESEGVPDLTDHQIEFLDSWLMLVEKFVNPKTVLESPHMLPTKPTLNQKVLIHFDANAFLSHVHKVSIQKEVVLFDGSEFIEYKRDCFLPCTVGI